MTSLSRLTLLSILLIVLACSRPPPGPSSAAVVDVPTTPGDIAVAPAQAPAPGPALSSSQRFDCGQSFVEVQDGARTLRFTAGRQLSPTRGAPHAFVELVLHEDGERVLSLESMAGTDPISGGLMITLTNVDVEKLPATVSTGYVEFTRPGSKSEREEFRIEDPDVHVTSYGAVGEIVEGDIAATEARNRSGQTTTLSVRFRVCRTNDHRVKH
jgi:hypothetical protein